MNYREKIRKAIECPQLNNTRYGEWGALTLEQRKYIKRLLDELDSADNCVKRLYFENKKQKEVIDDYKEDISNLFYIINKNCNELKCTSDEWLVIQKYQDKEVE